ncbi:hypothetical protein FBU59_000905 [Linderina macrospora]|uniref:Uncharacterized protein n=1 Tax=Linderina macrospora TaxID=4868 RepID=A0ACC1JFR3_9FUNG|nr:hypothetical protein FBU59_000905 [Linderina macrospora]
MSIFKFLHLVRLLRKHPAFSITSPELPDAVLQVGITLYQFGGETSSMRTVARLFDLSEKTVMQATKNTVTAIIDCLGAKITWPDAEDAEDFGDPQFEGAVGFMGTSSVGLDIEPEYLQEDFRCRAGDMSDKKFCIRVMAVVSPAREFVYFYSGSPGSTPDSAMLRSSPLFKDQDTHFGDDEYVLASRGFMSSTHFMPPFVGDQLAPRLTRTGEAQRLFNKAHEHLRQTTIKYVFTSWKHIFPSLHHLPVQIRNAKSLLFAKDWIQATAYLYNFLQMTPSEIDKVRLIYANGEYHPGYEYDEDYDEDSNLLPLDTGVTLLPQEM